MSVWGRDLCETVQAALAERLAGQLEPGEGLRVEGETGEDVRASFVLQGGPSGARLELEARVPIGPDGSRAAEEAALDALDLLLLEHLESGRRLRGSGVFEARELSGRAMQVRIERTFPELEAEADRLLGEGERRS